MKSLYLLSSNPEWLMSAGYRGYYSGNNARGEDRINAVYLVMFFV